MVMEDLDIGPIPTTLPPKKEIVGVTVQDMEVGLIRSTTLTCSVLENLLMALVEVDLGLVQALLPSIIQAIRVYHLVFIVMLITEVVMGITLDNFPHITIVD